MQKFLLLLCLIVASPLLFSQIDLNLLKGEWIIYKKEMKDGSKYFSQEIVKNPYEVFVFNKNSFFSKEYSNRENSIFPNTFKLDNNKIIINENRYKLIEKLSETELIYIDFFSEKSDNTNIRYFLKKYDILQQLDKANNINKDTLSTTIALTPMPNMDIFKNTPVNTYDPVFKAKGYLLFDIQNKDIKTYLTHTENLSPQNREKVISSFSTSYNYWDLSDVKKYRFIKMPFIVIGHQYNISNNTYAHIIAAYNTQKYDDIKTPLNSNDIENSQHFFKLGLNCFEHKNYTCAIQNFKKSAEENKYNLDAHYNYASICFALGKKEEACTKWSELIQYGQKTAEQEYNTNCKN